MRKKITVALATLVLFAVCGFAVRSAKSRTQSKARIGIVNHVYKAPLEVVGLKINGLAIEAGDQFNASQDWIKQLVIVVKNTSNRDLIGVGANVEFPYTAQDLPLLPEIEFKSGFNPVLKRGPTDFLLRPGETKELPLPNGWHKAVDQVVKMATELQRPTLLYNVTIKPELAAFSTTEVWVNGSYRVYQDGKWTEDEDAMKKVSMEVRKYWRNAPPRMFKGSAILGGCVKYAPPQDPIVCPGQNCPTCVVAPSDTILDPMGGTRKYRFIFCTDINGNCSCLVLESFPNFTIPCP